MFILICAVLSVIAGLANFIPYSVMMVKGTAHPHLFSWATWGILTGIGFVLSLTNGGGAGSIAFGFQSFGCIVVAIYALFRGTKDITLSDRISFVSALVVVIIYIFTKNPRMSVVLAAVIDCLGFIPTFRKSYMKPGDEPIMAYFLSFLCFLFSIGAIESFSFITLFYPLVMVISNFALVLFLLGRRKALSI